MSQRIDMSYCLLVCDKKLDLESLFFVSNVLQNISIRQKNNLTSYVRM